jgi:hypothetical protein
MTIHPDPALATSLSALLHEEQGRVVTDWAALVHLAQPALFTRLDAAEWSVRVADALGVLERQLESPERLRFPVLGGPEHDGMRALARRAVAGSLGLDHGLHTMQGVYFLLQEAMVARIEARFDGDRRVGAVMLVDRFIKQLSTAMAEAITQAHTHGLESAVEAAQYTR